MAPVTRSHLEQLLRESAEIDTEASVPSGEDPVARRIALYVELLRLAPNAEPTSKGRLLMSNDADGVHVFRFANVPIEIGRAPGCAVQLGDSEVSRCHCSVIGNEDGAWLEDLGSANGTWVNDQRVIGRILLRDGDVLRVGRTLLVCAIP